MHLLLAIHFIILLVVSFVSRSTASCASSDATYALCLSAGTNITTISKLFSKTELAKECHEHFVEELLEKSCDDGHHHHHAVNIPVRKHKIPTTAQRYIYGFIAVFIISALSLVGLLALPILYKLSFKYVLNLFTAIAVGTLFGDAMFHLIPFVLGLHKHDHHHHHSSSLIPDYQWKILLAVFILYIFYLLEIFLHWFAHYKHDHSSAHAHTHNLSNKLDETQPYTRVNIDFDLEHSHLHHNHTHHNLHQHLKTPSIYSNAKSHVNATSSPCTPCLYSNELHITTNPFTEEESSDDKSEQVSIVPKTYKTDFSEDLDCINPIIGQFKGKEISQERYSILLFVCVVLAVKSTGWMVLFGDSIHNFADGLAIGAAFSQDLMLGVTTTIAVACHELPHELGDYAVLLQSGFSHCRALLWNFLSATTAIIGFFIGSIMSDTENARQWIFAATIGMFLYIALVDLLPTLLSDGELEFKRFLVVNIGFLIGIAVMFLIAIYEDHILHLPFK